MRIYLVLSSLAIVLLFISNAVAQTVTDTTNTLNLGEVGKYK